MHAPLPHLVSSLPRGKVRYQWPLHRFACFCAGAVLFLICLGGVVTSENAGMSVPDWPTSYGYNPFFFPWQLMTGGIFWEHSHRLVGSGVGTLIYSLAIALCFQPRVWLRWLGLAAAIMVSIQGLLGGLRVTLMADQIGIFHALLAQGLLVTVTLVALFTSRWWLEARPQMVPRRWPTLVLAVTALIYLQAAIGATMRHEHAGLSINDFPTAYGQVWPRTDSAALAQYNRARAARHQLPVTPFRIEVQMVHRVGAGVITLGIIALAVATWRSAGSARLLRQGTLLWVGLVFLQVLLGAGTIWTNKAADVATTHMALGAMMLVTGALLAALGWRLREAPEARAGIEPA